MNKNRADLDQTDFFQYYLGLSCLAWFLWRQLLYETLERNSNIVGKGLLSLGNTSFAMRQFDLVLYCTIAADAKVNRPIYLTFTSTESTIHILIFIL